MIISLKTAVGILISSKSLFSKVGWVGTKWKPTNFQRWVSLSLYPPSLESIGSWAAKELLGVEKTQPYTELKIDQLQVVIDRFFFGDIKMFIELKRLHHL
jgi:hypothetical protein